MYEASCRYIGFSLVSRTTKHAQQASKWMYTCRGSKNRGAKAQSTDRQSSRWRCRCEAHCIYERDGYGVRMKRHPCVSVQGAGCYFSSPKLTKTSSIRDRLLLSSKRSSISLYRLRDVWALTEKQPASASLGVFRHEVAKTDLPRIKTKRKDISLHDRLSAWQTRLFEWRKPCVGLHHFFGIFFCWS